MNKAYEIVITLALAVALGVAIAVQSNWLIVFFAAVLIINVIKRLYLDDQEEHSGRHGKAKR